LDYFCLDFPLVILEQVFAIINTIYTQTSSVIGRLDNPDVFNAIYSVLEEVLLKGTMVFDKSVDCVIIRLVPIT